MTRVVFCYFCLTLLSASVYKVFLIADAGYSKHAFCFINRLIVYFQVVVRVFWYNDNSNSFVSRWFINE